MGDQVKQSYWMPIETAPVDLVFLVFAPHTEGGWMTVACRDTDGHVVDTMTGCPAGWTHWAFLPDAPR